MKEKSAQLKVQGIKVAYKSSVAERTSLVDGYFNQPEGSPTVVPNTTPLATDIYHLSLLLVCIFRTMFSTNLQGKEAGNRVDALVVQFLASVEQIGGACLPNKKSPI
jgi:hypothetical protein